MSTFPGPRLEDYLADAYRFELGTPEFERLVERYEPLREEVEGWLDRFEEDEQSWRGYRDAFDWERVLEERRPPAQTSAQVAMELWAKGETTVDQSRVLTGLPPLGAGRGGDTRRPKTPELRVIRSPRLLDSPVPASTAEEVERQRQKDVGALTKILERHGVLRRTLYRCPHRTSGVLCDAYRVSGEPCVECGDGLPPGVA